LFEINKIYNQNCIGENGMCVIPDKSIDMILCDLPYGTTKCKWDVIIPFNILWQQYERIIKPNGSIVLTASQPFTSELIHSNLKLFREHLVWVKHKPSNFACGKYMHLKYHEDIIVFAKNKPTYNPQMQERKSERVKQMQKGNSKNWRSKYKEENEVAFQTNYEPREWTVYDADLKYPSTIIQIPAVNSNGKEKVNHPTQKPIELFEYLIKTYTQEGEIVLDNCIGSGTTAIACINTNRNYIGFENDNTYYNLSLERVKNHKIA